VSNTIINPLLLLLLLVVTVVAMHYC